MRVVRVVSLGVLLTALVLATTLPPAAGASSDREAPRATEIGVTADEIRITVIADVDTPLAPGIFKGAADGVEAFAEYINSRGGLAGRKLVVDFIDSRLSADDARNAIIRACAESFAMVGTAAALLSNIEDQLTCRDRAGAPTGLPDIPFIASDITQQCSPITFPVTPPTLICDTKDDNPQTYQSNVSRGLYYKQRFGDDLHGVYVFAGDVRAARDTSYAALGQIREVCCTSDRDIDISATAPQSAYTPIAQTLKTDSSSYAQVVGSFSMVVATRKEAKLQGVNSVRVWDCASHCYDPRFLEQGGADVEDQFVDMNVLPFFNKADRKANRMLAAFYKHVGAENAGQLGAPYAWIAGVAFRDAVNAVVEEHGVNGLTRAALLDALNDIDEFDADGMYSSIDLAGRKPGPCHVLTQVQDGKFVRVHPKKPGTFSCPAGGIIEVELDLLER